MPAQVIDQKIRCFHCGDECPLSPVAASGKPFCCEGCKLVFEILSENNLTSYYQLNPSPGIARKKSVHEEAFAFLDDPEVCKKLLQFSDGRSARITFEIPQIHCSSCVWLLENLNRIDKGVGKSEVNFTRKELSILFDERTTSLRKIVERLSGIGYEPRLSLGSAGVKKTTDRATAYKIGIAGFCFGNIMLFSFPEYFSSDVYAETGFKGFFSYLNLALSLPVLFYSSSQFFRSAMLSLRQKFLNIDVPIALGIAVMFIRSCADILLETGPGYLDTMAGLVFFMLIGRAFQNKTYEHISFDRDYKSFFPISVMVKKNGRETSSPVSSIKPGDELVIRNGELVPADGCLTSGEANIDYSFVTGESLPVRVRQGEIVFAGGRQTGTAIQVSLIKSVSQSYLTQLWNSDSGSSRNESRFHQLVNSISHYFTLVLLGIAFAALGWWLWKGSPATAWNAFTAVLIIACPCALAISSPFTLGNMLRIFGRMGFYLKNYAVIEKLAKADTIVFDKTGTLTISGESNLEFKGVLIPEELMLVKSVAYNSSHALSKILCRQLEKTPVRKVENFFESAGKGISGMVNGIEIRIGTAEFLGIDLPKEENSTAIYVRIKGTVKGYFRIANTYRSGTGRVAGKLESDGYRISVLSGDHDQEKTNLRKLFPEAELLFHQSPADKLKYIRLLQSRGSVVLMVGDGLNDAGALKQSDAGITLAEDVSSFSPACDGILKASRFESLPGILGSAKISRRIILASFGIALVYNAAGLAYAVTGSLSPVIAAVLMPLSAVTIISFTTGMSNLALRILK